MPDFDAGQRTFGLLHGLGLEQVQMRAAALDFRLTPTDNSIHLHR
jgi:hypothetical protein